MWQSASIVKALSGRFYPTKGEYKGKIGNEKNPIRHQVKGRTILVVIQDKTTAIKQVLWGEGLGKKLTLLCNVKDMLTYLLLYILEICK